MFSFGILLLLAAQGRVQSQTPDPADDYYEIYPDPSDPDILQGRTPLYFALLQSLGGQYSQFVGPGVLAGVKVALDRINNETSLLPGYTLHYTAANSKCNRTESLNALHSLLLQEPTKLAVIGAGCSVATEPTAEISHYYNVTQISCFSTSTELSNRVRFPRYFQTATTEVTLAFGFYRVIKEYGWKRVSLIVQGENLFTETMASLKTLLDADEIEWNEKVFRSSEGISGLGSNPFDEDSRIFLLSMFPLHARPLLCEAYKRGYRFPKYLMLITGWHRRFWWRVEQPDIGCTADERESVLPSALAISQLVFLDEEGEDNDVPTTPGITINEFFEEQRKFYGQPPLNFSFFHFAHFCHDATWTLAYALNKTLESLTDVTVNDGIAQAFNITPPFKLEDFAYNNDKVLEIVFDHLHDTSYTGLTGPMSFGENGISNLNDIYVYQYRNRVKDGRTFVDRIEISSVTLETSEFTYLHGESAQTVWNGSIPYDGVPREVILTVHPALTYICITLACAGILFAAVCLVFNFINRNAKLIKLASTKLNYLIGIGAIILYVNTFLFVIPSTDVTVVTVLCNLTPWLTAIGYSLCYGTILVKMARVYYIFNNPSTSKKRIKDHILLLGVASLVGIDLIILVTYSLVEGLRGNLSAHQVPSGSNHMTVEGDLAININNFILICESTGRIVFLGVLYGYKMVLQIIALLFAFSIRKVKVKGLDDAKYIGAAIYVTSIVLAVIIVATYSLSDIIDGFTALFCFGFLIGTTVILALVFVPLMLGLYKDPKGEQIFTSTHVPSTLGAGKGMDNMFSSVDNSGLRRRIRELEDEVKVLKGATSTKQENMSVTWSVDKLSAQEEPESACEVEVVKVNEEKTDL